MLALGTLFPWRIGKSTSSRLLATPCNLNSNNHNQHDGSRCFYLAILIERSKPTPRYDISLLRNRASNLGGTAIPLQADCETLRRSTTAEPSCVRCKKCAGLAMRMTIRQNCMRRPPRDLLSWACRFHLRSSFNCGIERTSQNFEFVQGDTGAERQSAPMV